MPTPDHAECPAPPVPPGATCLACGYAIAGLSRTGRCPECGAAIERSLRGNMLEYADPSYVRRIRGGLDLVLLGSLLGGSWWVATPVLLAAFVEQQRMTFQTANTAILGLDFLTALVLLAGWWRATEPDPAMRDPATDVSARRRLRGLLLFIAAATLLGFGVALTPGLNTSNLSTIVGSVHIGPRTGWTPTLVIGLALRLLLIGARLARFFLGLLYLRAIALRIPSPALHRNATRQLWLVPLLSTVGLAFCGLGPLIAFILYLALVWRFRSALAAIGRRTVAGQAAGESLSSRG